MTNEIDTQPRRSWVSSHDDSKIRCLLKMDGRVTFSDVYNYFAEHYPDVDFWNIELNFGSATWVEEPTEDERQQRAAWREKQRERTEKWERETLTRLKAKYEPEAIETEAAQEATS